MLVSLPTLPSHEKTGVLALHLEGVLASDTDGTIPRTVQELEDASLRRHVCPFREYSVTSRDR
ncbi:MAG: hypothetical protein ACK5Q5_22260 [Planctomycetaceae bacterium]